MHSQISYIHALVRRFLAQHSELIHTHHPKRMVTCKVRRFVFQGARGPIHY